MNQPGVLEIMDQKGRGNSRRRLLRQLSCVSLGLPLAQMAGFASSDGQGTQQGPQQHTLPARPPLPTSLAPEDDQFLNDLEHANFLFFWEQGNPQTGLIKDRCNVRAKDTSVAPASLRRDLA